MAKKKKKKWLCDELQAVLDALPDDLRVEGVTGTRKSASGHAVRLTKYTSLRFHPKDPYWRAKKDRIEVVKSSWPHSYRPVRNSYYPRRKDGTFNLKGLIGAVRQHEQDCARNIEQNKAQEARMAEHAKLIEGLVPQIYSSDEIVLKSIPYANQTPKLQVGRRPRGDDEDDYFRYTRRDELSVTETPDGPRISGKLSLVGLTPDELSEILKIVERADARQ